ncbi:MAG: ABC transporter substrate-binding protein [Acidimicrobiaceae bacterium]|nr:ABC transporter substrate-binding protein [Acidimicrobiaceae bacterium]
MTCRGRRGLGSFAAVVGVLLAVVAAACGGSSKSTGSGTANSGSSGGSGAATKSPYRIGLVYPGTGSAADTYTGVVRAAQARLDVLNASGGINGHPVELVKADDQSSPTGNVTATQQLMSQGVLVLMQISPFTFASTRVMHAAGLPVVGSGTDAPEWGMQPNTNMFSLQTTLWDPKLPQYGLPPEIWRGATSVATFGYGVSPASADAAKGFAFAAKHAGIRVGYLNDSLPFGTVNATSLALAMKQQHVDGAYLPLDVGTNLAILTAAAQAGVHFKVAESGTGYGQALLDNPSARQVAQGVYFVVQGTPVEDKTPGTIAMTNAFAQYSHYTGVPDYGWYEGWESADLAIEGIRVAGNNPTRSSIVDNLRKVTHYDAGGLLASPADFTKFGQDPRTGCFWWAKLQGSTFVSASGAKPLCSALLPNSNQA